jgi:chitodextrinase
MADTTYSYQVTAKDAAGNVSAASSAASVKTPTISDAQAPTAPGEPKAEVVGPSQVNLTWGASTDNTGVTAYEVFRGAKGATPTKVASVTTTSLGDANLTANTTYEYYVVARDAAGNLSKNSTAIKLTTPATKENSDLVGYVRTASGTGIKGALVETYSNGRKVRALTDTRGFYEIDPISSGSHSITYSATGYKTVTSWRDIGIGRRIANNVNLQQQ